MINGEHLRLRALERSDIPLFVRWFNDPEVTDGLLTYLPLSTSDEERWFDEMLKTPPDQHPLSIEVLEGEKWVLIGNCGYQNIDYRCRLGEIGIVIGEKAYWNKGYGTEAMRLMVRHGFETLNLNRVFLHVYATNQRAIQSYEKVGFVHEGRLRQDMYKNGAYIDVLVMSILRSEWESARAKG
ncbi:MAG: GNAT family N-acetyltransferase [Chloroflexi bacterium]|nr:GNAT family N-acetyltransferase [Chloroflexota bacterium]